MPTIGRYTNYYFQYQGDVEYVCMLNDWIASSTKFALTIITLPSSGSCRSEKWEVYLYVDMTIQVVVSVSDAVSHWVVPQTQFIARAYGHPSCTETVGFQQRVHAMRG